MPERFNFLPDRLCCRFVRVGAPRVDRSGGGAQTHARELHTTNGKRARHLVAETRRANVRPVTASLTTAATAIAKRYATPVRRGRCHRGRRGHRGHRGPVGRRHVPTEFHAGGTVGARADARTAVDAGA